MPYMKALVAGVAGVIIGALTMYALQRALTAGEVSKNRRSIAEARNILDALEHYRATNGTYPPLDGGISGLATYVVPTFTKSIWPNDVYGRPYIIFIDRSGVAVASMGRNGFLVRRGRELPPRLPAAAEKVGESVDGPYRVSDDVHAPTVVRRVEPDFSRCKGRYHGSPAAEATVRRDGSITDIKLVRSVDPCIDGAFLTAIRLWHFRPGTLHGKPVDVRYAVTAHINYR